MTQSNRFFVNARQSIHQAAEKGNDVRSVLKVLVIHQQKLVANSIVFFLTSHGYAARASYSASATVSLLGLMQFDLIICSSSLLYTCEPRSRPARNNFVHHCSYGE
jgi:hypothetical protein